MLLLFSLALFFIVFRPGKNSAAFFRVFKRIEPITLLQATNSTSNTLTLRRQPSTVEPPRRRLRVPAAAVVENRLGNPRGGGDLLDLDPRAHRRLLPRLLKTVDK